MKDNKGPNNPFWKGGVYQSRGYIYVFSPNHPFKTKGGYVREHRLVMEQYLGRYLRPNEVIHHINGIVNDNRIDNLQIMTQSRHAQTHFKKDMSNRKCVICDSTETYFDKKGNCYLWYYKNHDKNKPICIDCYRLLNL